MTRNLIKNIRRHYRQSSLVHQLAEEAIRATTREEWDDKIHHIKEAEASFSYDDLPGWMVLFLEKYIGYVHPILFPFGTHTSFLTRRVRRFISKFIEH